MSRDEFMRRLEHLLADVTEEEKKEALAYYRGYFEDAGEENEERIIRELESPEKVAKTIKADLGITGGNENGEYTERGYQDERFTDHQDIGLRQKDAQQGTQQNTAGNPQQGTQQEDNSAKAWKIALIVTAVVLTSPVWIGLAGGLLGGTLGLAGGLFGILIAGIALAGSLFIAGAALIGVGIGCLAAGSAGVGIALAGSGFLVLALAMLATIASVWIYGRLLPWIVRGIVKFCRNLFSGKGRAA